MNDGPQTPQILIVGAGAMGLGAGYHLQLAGAAITFLVRPARVLEMSRSQVLYSYDDATLKAFTDYRLISDVAEISRSSYDYVIVTLDGFATRKPEETALLKSIGAAIRESSTEVIIGGIGVGLHDYYLRTMALPAHRILNGALGMLSHQVRITPARSNRSGSVVESGCCVSSHSQDQLPTRGPLPRSSAAVCRDLRCVRGILQRQSSSSRE
jgi:Ketopantoate reductase PanE/ApbA